MKCPKCNFRDPYYSSFCTKCGYLFRSKTNKWLTFFTVFFATVMIVFLILTIYLYSIYKDRCYDFQTKISTLQAEISTLQAKISTFENLERKLYKVTGNDAPCYVRKNDAFTQIDAYYSRDNIIEIYAEKKFYNYSDICGLTEDGCWIPMIYLKPCNINQ